MTDLLVPVALVGPALAAGVWLALSRWRWARWTGAGIVALAAHASAWAVFWLAYRGTPPEWRGTVPDLLDATIVVVAEIGIVIAALRAEGGRAVEAPGVVAALGVGASGLVGLAFAQSLVLVGVFLVVPTIAVAVAALGEAGRPNLAGLIGLAAADVVAVLGLTLVHARTGTVAFGPSPGVGATLVLAAAAAKMGAIPLVATWRLSANGSAAAPLAAVLRGQGIALTSLAGLTLAPAVPARPVAIAAASAMLASGLAGAVARRARSSLVGLAGAAAGVPFLAIGFGGSVGVRSFLLVFPAFLLASAATEALAPIDEPRSVTTRPASWPWTGTIGLGVALASLAAVPTGGGFPGTWLALSLGVERAAADPLMLLVVGAAAAGLGIALIAAGPLTRAAEPRPALAVAGALAAAALLYVGTQPVRLGIGWWLRVEATLGLPELLPSAGAPRLPPLGGSDLLLAVGPALVLAVGVVALGRGVRDARLAAPGALRRTRRRGRPLTLRGRLAERRSILLERTRVLGLDLGAALVVEVGALVLAARLVVVAARTGFL